MSQPGKDISKAEAFVNDVKRVLNEKRLAAFGAIKEVKRWEDYKTFFQITIFKYLVMWFSLVPVAAGLLKQLPEPIVVKINDVSFDLYLNLPFNWQILWLSSLFFVIALGIYKWKCPDFIQKYNNYSDYKLYEHHPRWLTWLVYELLKEANDSQKDKLVERLESKNYLTHLSGQLDIDLSDKPIVEERQTILMFRHNEKFYQFGMPILQNENNDRDLTDSVKDVFYEVFGIYSANNSIARHSIKVLLFFSFSLFLFVLSQHISTGGSYVWSWIRE